MQVTAAGPAKAGAPVPAIARFNDSGSPMSCSTLVGADEATSIATPSVPAAPRNSPVRSELQRSSNEDSQQQQQQLSSNAAASTVNGADADTLGTRSTKLSFRQRIRDSIGVMKKMLSRDSSPFGRLLSFPYGGHSRKRTTATSGPGEAATSREGYEGDTEGQDDILSDSLLSTPEPPPVMLTIDAQLHSDRTPFSIERIDEMPAEGSNVGVSGSPANQPVFSGDEGDDEATAKQKVKNGATK
ncbi:hypothetical protein KEM56_000028 [Ascosphaera pollenicola]|nr:hypothetical protein KEM56_000028 [Ascosphaera pollenicola]